MTHRGGSVAAVQEGAGEVVRDEEPSMGREWRLPLCRSYLDLPATQPELFPEVLASEADAVIVDLEDVARLPIAGIRTPVASRAV